MVKWIMSQFVGRIRPLLGQILVRRMNKFRYPGLVAYSYDNDISLPGEPRHDVRDRSAGDELEAGEPVGGEAVRQVVAHPVDLREVRTAHHVTSVSRDERSKCNFVHGS